MSSHTQAIAMLGKPLTDEEAERLMSKRIDAKWVEALADEWRDMQRAIAGQPSEAERIIQQMKEMRQ